MKIYVRVPYPNKYAEAELQISASKIGEDVVFTVPVFNFGRQNIDGVSAEVEIYGPNNEKLGMAKAESISLAASQSGKLVARWRADVKPGIYHAVAMVDYDGQSAKAERDFDLGDLRVKATAIDVGNFRLGNVAKMDILLENLWNQPLKNVYGEVEVRDQSKSYTKFKTAGVDLEPYSKGMIISYWDTTGVPVGRYIVDVLLSYANQNTTDSFEVDVNLDTIRTAAMATGEVIESDKSKLGTSTAIVLLVIVIIALNIGWFVYKSRIKNKKR
jgi:hypothetical protein